MSTLSQDTKIKTVLDDNPTAQENPYEAKLPNLQTQSSLPEIEIIKIAHEVHIILDNQWYEDTDRLKELLSNLSSNDFDRVAQHYNKTFDKPLIADLRENLTTYFSNDDGPFRDVMGAILHDQSAVNNAHKIYYSIDFMGIDDGGERFQATVLNLKTNTTTSLASTANAFNLMYGDLGANLDQAMLKYFPDKTLALNIVNELNGNVPMLPQADLNMDMFRKYELGTPYIAPRERPENNKTPLSPQYPKFPTELIPPIPEQLKQREEEEQKKTEQELFEQGYKKA